MLPAMHSYSCRMHSKNDGSTFRQMQPWVAKDLWYLSLPKVWSQPFCNWPKRISLATKWVYIFHSSIPPNTWLKENNSPEIPIPSDTLRWVSASELHKGLLNLQWHATGNAARPRCQRIRTAQTRPQKDGWICSTVQDWSTRKSEALCRCLFLEQWQRVLKKLWQCWYSNTLNIWKWKERAAVIFLGSGGLQRRNNWAKAQRQMLQWTPAQASPAALPGGSSQTSTERKSKTLERCQLVLRDLFLSGSIWQWRSIFLCSFVALLFSLNRGQGSIEGPLLSFNEEIICHVGCDDHHRVHHPENQVQDQLD